MLDGSPTGKPQTSSTDAQAGGLMAGFDNGRPDTGTSALATPTKPDEGSKPEEDRRQSKRMSYPCAAMVANYQCPDVPPKEAFWTVRCRDLSRGGVSFYSPIKPLASSLLISLGSAQTLSCLLACRVVYCAYVGDHGQPRYLVGCEFMERLN
ncbi:MAG TPA: PilZ domain-containing protein [Pirellulales bacterium]|nr:PilZ domain-containing protein [Pirellulales bacterium]